MENKRPINQGNRRNRGKERMGFHCIASTAALTASVLLCHEEDIPPGLGMRERGPLVESDGREDEMTENDGE